jgi:hypothetical protein
LLIPRRSEPDAASGQSAVASIAGSRSGLPCAGTILFRSLRFVTQVTLTGESVWLTEYGQMLGSVAEIVRTFVAAPGVSQKGLLQCFGPNY